MRISSVTLRRVAIPFLEPFRIANGEVSVKEAVILALSTSAGVTGWGEASPMGGAFYSAETPDSTWTALAETLAPALLSGGETTPESAADLLDQFPGEPFARAGLEGAVWDARSRAEGVPLHTLLGGRSCPIPSGVAIGMFDDPVEVLERIARYLGEGYVRVKVKIEPGRDADLLRAVRRKFPSVPLMVDANASYDLRVHRRDLRALDGFDLMMIEQPLAKDAFEDAAELQRLLRTPICADESADSLTSLETIIALGCARIVNVKIQRVGGLRNARRIAERAMRAEIPCWLGTMPELGIASLQGIHLATHPAFTLPTDVESSGRWYAEDVVEPPITIGADGTLAAGELRVDHAALERRTIQSITLE